AHIFLYSYSVDSQDLHSFPTRRSSDLNYPAIAGCVNEDSARETLACDQRTIVQPARLFVRGCVGQQLCDRLLDIGDADGLLEVRSEEHTSELQSLRHLVCRLLLEKKKK